jgi:hypothetical protein
MKRGAYIFWLTLLAAILFGGSRFLPAGTTGLHHQKSDANTPKRRQTVRVQPKISAPKPSIRLVTLYPAGSLKIPKSEQVKVTSTEKTKRSSPPRKLTKSSPIPKSAPQPNPPSVERDGDRPVLEVSYDEIGFDRYLDVIERIGRLFLLVVQGQNMRLGPEVSLRTLSVLGSGPSHTEHLAVERPHLVNDPFIRDLLSAIILPSGALDDRIVLLLNQPFDDLLWELIRETAREKNIRISDIAKISGSYVGKKSGVFLILQHVVLRNSNKRVSFARHIRVTL